MATKRAPSATATATSTNKRPRTEQQHQQQEQEQQQQQRWRRPQLPPLSPAENEIVFQQLEIDYLQGEPLPDMPGASEGPVPIIRLYGVTEEGNSILCWVHGFTPYFYCKAPEKFEPKDCYQFMKLLEARMQSQIIQKNRHTNRKPYVLSVEMVSDLKSVMNYTGPQAQSFLRIDLSLPKHVPTCRSIIETGFYQGRCLTTFESDIVFVLRYMIDVGMVGCCWMRAPPGAWSHHTAKHSNCQLEIDISYQRLDCLGVEGEWSKLAPLRILSFDIECAGRVGCFPEAKKDPVIQIANMVTVVGENTPIVKNIMSFGTCGNIYDSDVHVFNNEKSMLKFWKNFVVECDPDIITGYNIINFDIPYLIQRARTLMPRGNDFPTFGRLTGQTVKMKDSTFSSRAYGTRESKELSIDGRVTFDMLQVMQREYKLRAYSLNFVSAHFLGEQKEDMHYANISILWKGTADDRRRIAVYCLKDAYLPQRLMDKLMCLINYVEMSRVTGVPLGFLLPRGQQIKVLSQLYRKSKEEKLLIPYVHKTELGGKFEGAIVLPPVRGFYDTPIATLDFSSLYPSIMISHNLCYSTLTSRRVVDSLNLEEGRDYDISPKGDIFVKPSVREGLLPRILKSLH